MRPLALARGGETRGGLPDRISIALRQAIDAHPEGCFVLADEHGQRELGYAACLAQALRVLGGLREAGLRPGDPLIVDVGDPEVAIPVLWAGLLGALVIAPLAASRWNERARAEFAARLEEVASRLGFPPIVSSDPRHFGLAACRSLPPTVLAQAAPVDPSTLPSDGSGMLLVSTSGTTGRSQLVELGERALLHRWWPSGLEAGADRSWLGWMPMDHVMGLGMAAPSARIKVHLAPETFVLRPERWLELAEARRVTHAGMSSFGIRRVVEAIERGRTFDLSSLQRVGVGAEPVDRRACARFLESIVRLGAARDAVILGYGLSECGPVAGGERSWHPEVDPRGSVAIDRPTAGHEIRIVDAAGAILPEGETGAIEVRGPTMTSGYHRDPVATARLLTPDGWIRTGDLGWLDDGCLHVSGRAKEVLIVNARKFSCLEIDEVAASVKGVAAAHSFAVLDEGAGLERPALVYVPAGHPVDLARIEHEIRQACSARFGFGLFRCFAARAEDLPRTHSGKIQRHRLATLLPAAIPGPDANAATTGKTIRATDASTPRGRPLAPGTGSTLGRVIAIMAQFLPGDPPGPDDDFFELGGDSLGALTLVVELERAFGVTLPPAVLTRRPNARAISEYLQTDAAFGDAVRIVEPSRQTVTEALFIAPGIWGYNGFAGPFERELGAGIGLWTLHLSDSEPQAQWPGSLEELVRRCLSQVRQVQPEGPYHFAGHSFGALLAFEMARQVLAAGDRVATLSVIDLAAGLDSRRFGAAAAGSVPRNRFELNRRLAAPYLVAPIDCRVDYYRAMDSHRLDLSDPTGGWCHLALAGVRVLDLPGDHHTVVRGESRRRIAEAISAAIEGRADGVFHPPEPIHERVFAGIERARRSAIDGDLPAEIESLVSAIHVADGIGARLPAWVPANLAAARFDQGRVSEALTAYRSAMERSHSPLQVAARFASMLRRHRLEDPAREALRLATRTRIETVASATACATILLTFGRQPEAERVLRAGIGMIPQSLELRSLLVGLLAISGRNAELLSEAEQALALRSENEEVYGAIGRAAASAGGHAIALRCIERCLAINPMRRDIAAVVDRMRGRAG